jgi:hypothetical protein
MLPGRPLAAALHPLARAPRAPPAPAPPPAAARPVRVSASPLHSLRRPGPPAAPFAHGDPGAVCNTFDSQPRAKQGRGRINRRSNYMHAQARALTSHRAAPRRVTSHVLRRPSRDHAQHDACECIRVGAVRLLRPRARSALRLRLRLLLLLLRRRARRRPRLGGGPRGGRGGVLEAARRARLPELGRLPGGLIPPIGLAWGGGWGSGVVEWGRRRGRRVWGSGWQVTDKATKLVKAAGRAAGARRACLWPCP